MGRTPQHWRLRGPVHWCSFAVCREVLPGGGHPPLCLAECPWPLGLWAQAVVGQGQWKRLTRGKTVRSP